MGLLEVRDQRITRFHWQETRSRMTALTARSFVFHSLVRIGVHARPDQDTSGDSRLTSEKIPVGRQAGWGETSVPFWPVVLLHIEDEVRGLAGFG